MTREEAIKQCEGFIENHSEWSVEVEWANGVEFVLEDYKRLIKQEPREVEDYENEIADLYNRLDIAEYDKERFREALGKIRAEINNLTVYYTTKDKGINLISQNAVNRIIDKYKAESEVEDENE